MKAGSTAQNVDKRHVGGQRMCAINESLRPTRLP